MSSEAPRSPSYDPSVEDIEQRVFTYDPNDPDWEDDDDEDDDDMDYEPAQEGNEDEEDEDFHGRVSTDMERRNHIADEMLRRCRGRLQWCRYRIPGGRRW